MAEKFEAMVRFGRSNSRMKDIRDLTTFARRIEFHGDILGKAVQATFSRRRTNLDDLDDILDPGFYDDAALDQRWRSYCRTTGTNEESETFRAVGAELTTFLRLLAEVLRGQEPPLAWRPEVGWTRE